MRARQSDCFEGMCPAMRAGRCIGGQGGGQACEDVLVDLFKAAAWREFVVMVYSKLRRSTVTVKK